MHMVVVDNFVLLPSEINIVTGEGGEETRVLRADLMALGITTIQSITITDNGDEGTGTGRFTGIDLDGFIVSPELATTAPLARPLQDTSPCAADFAALTPQDVAFAAGDTRVGAFGGDLVGTDGAGNPLLGEIEFAYDAQDNLTQVSDPREVTTSYAYNGFDELTRLTSPDTGITDYDYDPAGNLLSRTDARGVEATYQYDAENRLTQIDYPAHNGQPAETLSFSYDDSSNGNAGKGRLTAIADGSGNTTLTYDRHGRITAKTQTVGNGTARTLQTSYLPNGRVEGHVLPSGAVCRYSYRADGRVLSITVNGVEIVSEIDYYAFGEVRRWDYATTGQYQRAFDQDGRIREHSAGSASRSIAFDPASRITAIADNAGDRHDWSFGYDDVDRLTSADNPATQGPVAATSLAWDYDPTGNRTSQTNAGTPLSYSIDPNSNRLLQVGANARQYDEVGNTLNDGNGITSTYSPRNRLIQTSNAGLSTTYAHNGFGERVCKAIDSSQACASSTDRIEYVYDENGHLIGEYPVGGITAPAVEYVWLDDTPIAVLQRRTGSTNGGPTGGGTATVWSGTQAGGVDVYYLHPDHLDTPRVVVNAQNQEIWRWDAGPFGDTVADEQPSGGLPSYTHNLRFPGQQKLASAKCPKCGRFRIGKGPCPCGKGGAK